MAKYLFGPAGWIYSDWEGTIYPADQEGKKFNRLKFIADRFDFVELNSSFYHIPPLRLVGGWRRIKQESPQFFFWVKGWQKFTHLRDFQLADLLNFKQFLGTMSQAGLLRGIIWQFPYSFGCSQSNFEYLQRMANQFCEFTQAFEFRKRDWLNSALLSFLKQKQLIWVNIDQPLISFNLPLTAIATVSGAAYFRFHGRNRQSWFSGEGRNQRYDYEYRETELLQLKSKVEKLTTVNEVFIVFNNHYRGSAIRNLERLRQLMDSTSSLSSSTGC